MADKLVTGATAGLLPVVANTTGVDTLVIDVANAVFEGDVAPAKAVSALGVATVGVLVTVWSYFENFTGFGQWDSWLTSIAIGVGIALIVIALLIVWD